MQDIVIVGSGGLAREFSSYFSGCVNVLGFSSTNHGEHGQFNLPGVLFKDEITPEMVGTDKLVIAIGDPGVRERLYGNLKERGFSFPPMVHPSSVVSDRAVLEEGVVVSPNCVVSPNVTLKALAYINFCCGIGHDAVIGRFVQVNPGCQVGGGARIGDGSLLGSGAIVLQGVSVGQGATVGSGSVVFSRVADGATVMGNPAKRLRAFE